MLVSWYRKSNLIHAPKSKLLCRQAHVYVYEQKLKKKKKNLLAWSLINVMLIMKLNKSDITIIQV